MTAPNETINDNATIEEVKPPVIKTKDFVAKDYSEDEFKKYIELYEKTFNVIKENEIAKGKVVAISGNDVLIDIGFKSDGRVSIDEFPDPDNIKIGDEVEIFVEKIEDREGQLVLSRKRADIIRNWEKITAAKENDTVIQGKCVRRIKGGFVVDLGGINAFLPGSQIDTKPIRDYDVFVNKMMDFKILKINHPNENIIVSHKVLIEESMSEQRGKLLATLESGQVLTSTVKAITDFGVFVDLGGVDGLIHITDLSWGRINHPSDVVSLDETIDVKVLEYDKEKKRVTLGLKQLQPHPWENIEEKLKIGDKVSGKVAYWHEDSYIGTDLRPVFAYHHFPTEVFGGGRALVYAAQLRVKLTNSLQLVAYKDGYMDIQLKGYNEPGWNDIAAGLKWAFLQNDELKLHAAVGVAYEFASGDDEVLQDDDEVRFWASVNKTFGKLHLGATFNYFLCTDNGDDPFTDSNHLSWHLHADYQVCKWFSPVVEVNGYHVVAEGDVVTPFQGSDVLNLGGDQSEDVVTVAVGAEIRPCSKFAVRAAYERAITDNVDLWGHRWTFSSVIEF